MLIKKIKLLFPVLLTCLLFYQHAKAQQRGLSSITNSGKVWALLYQQRAAEYRALCFQAYNIAKLRLDEAIKHRGKKPFAVITDIDETVLDNSPYDAARAINNLDFDITEWKKWTAKGIADTVPGAPSFFKYAASKGVAVFYITNRDEDERAGTLKNLKHYNLPNADDAHLLLKQSISDKLPRQGQVLYTHNVILFCGDNLADFNGLYNDKPSEQSRKITTEFLKAQFGNRYIVIPNPAYGDFENAFFKFKNLTDRQKDSVIRADIKVDR